VSGDHDHDELRIQLTRPAQDLHAIDMGHLQIGQEDLGALAFEE
jgi:hypothetical protein